MRFRYTLLYVQDVAASIAFYEQAFGQRRKFLADGNSYGELDTEGTVLGFVSVAQASGNLPGGFRAGSLKEKPGNVEVGFVTDDVQAAYGKAVKAGAKPYAPPSANHGARSSLTCATRTAFSSRSRGRWTTDHDQTAEPAENPVVSAVFASPAVGQAKAPNSSGRRRSNSEFARTSFAPVSRALASLATSV